MIDSKFKLTNKVDPTLTVETSFVASDTSAGDGSAMQTFRAEDGTEYVFYHPSIADLDITKLENADWTIEQLPYPTE